MNLIKTLSFQAKETFGCRALGMRLFLKDGSHMGCLSSDVSFCKDLRGELGKHANMVYQKEVKKAFFNGKNISRRVIKDNSIPYLSMLYKKYGLWNTIVLYEKRKEGVAGYYFCNLQNIESFDFECAFKFGRVATDLLEEGLLKGTKDSNIGISLDDNLDRHFSLFVRGKEYKLTWKQYYLFVSFKIFNIKLKIVSWYLGTSESTAKVYIKRVQEKIEKDFNISLDNFFVMEVFSDPRNRINFKCFFDYQDFMPIAPN